MDESFFKKWFIFCAALSVVMLAGGLWALVSLISWITTK